MRGSRRTAKPDRSKPAPAQTAWTSASGAPADAGGVASSADAFNQALATSNAQLLADDTPAVVALLGELRSAGGGATIDLVVDNNAGFGELCTDGPPAR